MYICIISAKQNQTWCFLGFGIWVHDFFTVSQIFKDLLCRVLSRVHLFQSHSLFFFSPEAGNPVKILNQECVRPGLPREYYHKDRDLQIQLPFILRWQRKRGDTRWGSTQGFFCEFFWEIDYQKHPSDILPLLTIFGLFLPGLLIILDCWNNWQRHLISVIPKKNITDEACFTLRVTSDLSFPHLTRRTIALEKDMCMCLDADVVFLLLFFCPLLLPFSLSSSLSAELSMKSCFNNLAQLRQGRGRRGGTPRVFC